MCFLSPFQYVAPTSTVCRNDARRSLTDHASTHEHPSMMYPSASCIQIPSSPSSQIVTTLGSSQMASRDLYEVLFLGCRLSGLDRSIRMFMAFTQPPE